MGGERKAYFEAFQRLWHAEPPEDWLIGKEGAEVYFGRVANRLGIEPQELLQEARAGCAHWTLIESDAVSLIRKIQDQGIQVVLATENVDALERWILPAMGLERAFDAILNSARLGCLKSDVDAEGKSLFFKPYLDANGILPGESVLIDDTQGLATTMASTGIRFLHAPFGIGPGEHLRALLT